MTHWIELLLAIVDGPTSPISGIVRAVHPDSDPRTVYDGHYGIAPTHIGFGYGDVRVYRDGRKSRIETLDGAPTFIHDGHTCWVFDDEHDDPIETNLLNTRIHDPGKELVVSRPAEMWARPGFTRPIRPIEEVKFLGRRCWKVAMTSGHDRPPEVLVVDVDTGTVLQQDNDGGAAAYVEFEAPSALPAGIFDWSGAVRKPRDVRAEQLALELARRQRDSDWFREHVCATSVHAAVTVDFTPTEVRRDSQHPDSFEAEFEKGAGRLWRRARSTETWNLPVNWTAHYPTPIRAWSTQNFDWACGINLGRHSLTDTTVTELQNALHPGEPVVGTPPLSSPTPAPTP